MMCMKDYQRKEQTLAVAIDLENAYNRVQFKLLMDLIVQYGVSLTLTRWIAEVLLERTVLYNVYTKCPADLNQNGLSRVHTRADDGLKYKRTRDTQEPKLCNNNWKMYPNGAKVVCHCEEEVVHA